MLELLVAIAIVIVLVALGLPVITRHIEQGRASACMGKLRNLAITMTHFRTERGQKMWDLRTVAAGGEGSITPVQIFYRYGLVESASELCCPSATNAANGAWTTGGSGSTDYVAKIANQYMSYAVNGIAFYQGSPWKMTNVPMTSYLYFSEVESKTPLFLDGHVFQLNATSWQPAMRFTRIAMRHQEHCNVLFLDGHVESLSRSQVERLDPYGGTNPAWVRDFGVDE